MVHSWKKKGAGEKVQGNLHKVGWKSPIFGSFYYFSYWLESLDNMPELQGKTLSFIYRAVFLFPLSKAKEKDGLLEMVYTRSRQTLLEDKEFVFSISNTLIL